MYKYNTEVKISTLTAQIRLCGFATTYFTPYLWHFDCSIFIHQENLFCSFEIRLISSWSCKKYLTIIIVEEYIDDQTGPFKSMVRGPLLIAFVFLRVILFLNEKFTGLR